MVTERLYLSVLEIPITLPLSELAVDMFGASEKRFQHADAMELGHSLDVQNTESRIAIRKGGYTPSLISDIYIRVSEKWLSVNSGIFGLSFYC